MNATYILWHPRLTGGTNNLPNSISFDVTRLASQLPPYGSNAFYRTLLADMGVRAGVISWDVLPYRSRYHGELESRRWQEQWPINWRISVRTSPVIRELPPQTDEYTETLAFPTQANKNDSDHVNCIVRADFRMGAVDDQVEDNVRHQFAMAEKKTGGDHVNLSMERFPIGKEFLQLQIDLGEHKESEFLKIVPVALQVERVCHYLGGICYFEQRANAWGEAYEDSA
jgi:hypothetical protein